MNLAAMSTTEIIIIAAVVTILAAVIGVWFFVGRRRTGRLQNKFGRAEYSRAMEEGGSKRKAEAVLGARAERVEKLNIQPLTAADRARFLEEWGRVQARFVDSPGGAVTSADHLLGDVMSKRGYPVSDFDQRSADISVDYPLVLENYRAGHQIALTQANGKASTEELRQAMIHYRALFDELVREPEMARAQTA
jgi:hypothetical protein